MPSLLVVEYLLKPIDFHQLREVVERALELSRLRHTSAVFDKAEAQTIPSTILAGL
jgi:hypothetical protein